MTDAPVNPLCLRHLRFAWWSLGCFVLLGLTLEAAHALKASWYLGKDAETRRLLWTLAHAHGTLLALIHAAFAFTLTLVPPTRGLRLASALLLAASVLLPGGFFLGGIYLYDGDPGLGVWAIPPGAACLLGAVLLTGLAVTPARS